MSSSTSKHIISTRIYHHEIVGFRNKSGETIRNCKRVAMKGWWQSAVAEVRKVCWSNPHFKHIQWIQTIRSTMSVNWVSSLSFLCINREAFMESKIKGDLSRYCTSCGRTILPLCYKQDGCYGGWNIPGPSKVGNCRQVRMKCRFALCLRWQIERANDVTLLYKRSRFCAGMEWSAWRKRHSSRNGLISWIWTDWPFPETEFDWWVLYFSKFESSGGRFTGAEWTSKERYFVSDLSETSGKTGMGLSPVSIFWPEILGLTLDSTRQFPTMHVILKLHMSSHNRLTWLKMSYICCEGLHPMATMDRA